MIQMSVDLRNARLDAIETTLGTGAIIKIRTGAQPANCAAADSGTVLATLTLASDWAGAASSGSKSLSSTPLDTLGLADDDAGHFRIYRSNGTTCDYQGSVTATGGGGDLTLDDISIVTDQIVTITSWSITDGNA